MQKCQMPGQRLGKRNLNWVCLMILDVVPDTWENLNKYLLNE